MRLGATDVHAGGTARGIVGVLLAGFLLGSAAPLRFVPGEVLVKFAPGTDGSAAVARASRTSPPDLTALAPMIPRFQAATGVPLRAKQVTGGQWILVSVDGERLVDELATRLRGRANVADVQLSPHPSPRDTSRSRGILARFAAGSPEFEAIARKQGGGGDAPFLALVSALEQDVGLSLKVEAAADRALLLHVDLGPLTLRLSEQLKALADVESAQPNNVLRIR